MIQPGARVGLVLGGGGVLGGAWEAGALQALRQETGWDPRDADCLIGTSVGSLVAALLAAGILPDMELVEAAAHHLEAFPWPIPGSWDLGLTGAKERGPRKWIMTVAGLLPRGPLSTRPIQDSVEHRIPRGWPARRRLWITATDYRTGERVVFGRFGAPAADLSTAVAASCAIPGVYPVSSPRVARGARRLADRLQGVAEHAAHRNLIAEADALRASGTPVLLIEPGSADLAAMGLNLMNRKRAHFVFETAVTTVANQLRSAHMGERLESRTGPAGSIR